MFGYVNIYKPEMKVKDYEKFKAYYCGHCKAMGKSGNQLSRLGLNYDFVFLTILLSSIEKNEEVIEVEGCIKNFLAKKNIVKKTKSMSYSSDMSIILVYLKLLDDWKDERSIKSLLYNLPFIFSSKKIQGRHGAKVSRIKCGIEELSNLEAENCKIVDRMADIFGSIMSEIMVADYIKDSRKQKILSVLGYNLGRWIYTIDALEDIDDDIEEGSYNPLVLQYSYSKNESVEDFRARIKEDMEISLFMSLDAIAKSFELLDIEKNREILENIIYMGMRNKTEHILAKGVI